MKATSRCRRILIRGGHILSQDPSVGELKGDILVEGAHIVEIGPSLQISADEVIDASRMIIMPGFIDTHRHTWEAVLRHIGAGWNFTDYIMKFYVAYGAHFTPQDVYAGNLLGAAAALDAGITTLRDESNIQNSPDHTDAAIQALRDSGLRAVFDYGWPATEPAAWGRESVRPQPRDIRRIRRDVLHADDALVTLSMMLRGPQYTTVEVAKTDLQMMRDLGLRGCIHAGCGLASRKNPGVLQLHQHGLMGPDLTFIHCCECTDEELHMIRDTGGTVSVPAISDATMPGLGLPITGRLLKAGIRPSLSVDVEVSGAADMFTVMRTAYTAQQLELQHNPELAEQSVRFDARDLLAFATIEGARACGLDHKTGSLTPGKAADIIFLRADAVNLAPVTDPAAAIVLGAHPGNVDTVMVDGGIVKRDGRLLHLDVAQIARLGEQARDRLLKAQARGATF